MTELKRRLGRRGGPVPLPKAPFAATELEPKELDWPTVTGTPSPTKLYVHTQADKLRLGPPLRHSCSIELFGHEVALTVLPSLVASFDQGASAG